MFAVLDASSGRPASGVVVGLEVLSFTATEQTSTATLPSALATGATNADGRCTNLLDPSERLRPGVYKMIFETGPYFEAQKVSTFYPVVEITFAYTDPDQHYHIPLLLSPFSYTTYRGN